MKYTPKECFGCAKDNKLCAVEKDFIKMERVEDWPPVRGVQMVHCPDAEPRKNPEHARIMKICYQEAK